MMMRFTPRCWLSCLALVATVEGFALLSAPPLPAAARAPGSFHSSWSCAECSEEESPLQRRADQSWLFGLALRQWWQFIRV